MLMVGEDLRGLLRQDGHRITWLPRVDEWRSAERELAPELVVAAVESPEPLLSVPGKAPRGFCAPLLLVERETDFERDVYLDERLVDRMQQPFQADEFLARVEALLRIRRVMHGGSATPEPRPEKFRERLAALLGSRLPRLDRPLAPFLAVAARVADWADRRDAFEPGHAERVTSFCAMIAEELGVGGEETGSLLRAAMLHDVGKASLPAEILHQRTPLEDTQLRLIRTHPRRGATLLRALDHDEAAADTILCHHERPDGNGYYRRPQDSVPRGAFILAVAECFDAMTRTRLRPPLSADEALATLHDERGRAFDAECVDALASCLTPARRGLPVSH
ncbi:MAG TPA: HD domain-containing phosphohydrolase [Candidatus Polarisedimenticolaceae bacterium]|nr:HD domain-containing phosphohydrolase [Candidatus Polarisedimenticolaceae bacterium]